MSYKKTAKEYFALNLNPVPVKKGTKEPARKEHQTEIEEEIEERAICEIWG